MHNVSDIIKELGGTSAVAAAMSLTPSTVSSWKTSGRIPNWRQDALIALAAKKGLSLTAQSFGVAA